MYHRLNVLAVYFLPLDDEPPVLLFCPGDLTEPTSAQTRQLSWDPPRFIDNTEVVSIETNSQADTFVATLDARTEVWYQAIDKAGLHAYCNFTVALKRRKHVTQILFL